MRLILKNTTRKEIAIFTLLTAISLISAGCGQSGKNVENYKAKINAWHKKRIKKLTQKDGWLTLAGLYWLKPGQNSFGTAKDNDIVFPAGTAPKHIGSITRKENSMSISINKGVKVTTGGNPVTNMKLKIDTAAHPTILHLGSLSWYIIKRGDKLGVRLKNSASKLLKNFHGIKRFPVSKKYRVEATYIPLDTTRIIEVPSVIHQTRQVKISGILQFHLNGKILSLVPFAEGDKWFIVFGDKTNGKTTHGGGRFLYVKKVKGGETTIIDFNKAYNPPCSFTPYATCLLPPSENRLPVAIKAGEKSYTENLTNNNKT